MKSESWKESLDKVVTQAPDYEEYYYLRDKQKRPTVTVCLVSGNRGLSRGIAVCSLRDHPVKKVGRALAKKRALQAYWTKKNTQYLTSKRAKLVIMDTSSFGEGMPTWMGMPKSTFEPVLTDREVEILFF